MKASEPVKLVLKKSGPYRAFSGGEESLRDGNELSRRIGLPQADRLEEQEGERVYRQEAKTPEGCTQTLLLAEIEAGQSFAIVKYECTLGLADAAAVMAHQQELDAKLAGLHFDGRWNVMVQGSWPGRTRCSLRLCWTGCGRRFMRRKRSDIRTAVR
ncbi:hypothetical protein LJK87_30910 [Paenibacillus sp. P25]|nr:hypothetical protein LJK87_30910 [Paenibacillus sp. P25]